MADLTLEIVHPLTLQPLPRDRATSAKADPSLACFIFRFLRPPQSVRRSALRADSLLARLSDTEFEQGMAALRAHGANINPAEAITEEIDWFVFTKRA